MKKIIFVIANILLIAIVLFCVYIQTDNYIDEVRCVISTADGAVQSVSLFRSGDKYYAFLPSYTDFNSMVIECNNGGTVYIDGVLYDSNTSCSKLKENKDYLLEIKNSIGITISEETLVIMKSSNIPSLSINLSNGTIENINSSKSVSKTGIMQLVKEDSSIDYSGSFKAIHGRGNSTWSQPKKSYSLIFSSEVDLLGMGLARKWVLLANPFDESNLRNKLSYDAAKTLGMEYAVDSEYVELYLDNVYYGLYLLTEKVEVGKNRVDISDLESETQRLNAGVLSTYELVEQIVDGAQISGFDVPNNPDDITGGYLLELYPGYENPTGVSFKTEGNVFEFVSPQNPSIDQAGYIARYINQVETDVRKGVLDKIDLNSFVDYYILREMFACNDVHSCFYYKDVDDDVVYIGPLWDNDLTIGNLLGSPQNSATALYYDSANWYPYLCSNEEFKQALKISYEMKIKPYVDQIVYKKVDELSALIERSFLMDKVRWKDSISEFGDKSQSHYDTIYEHAAEIKNYMERRFDFLDLVWADGVEYCTVIFTSYETFPQKIIKSVPKGTKLAELPIVESYAGNVFDGWFDVNGNAIDVDKPVSESYNYYARWRGDLQTTQDYGLVYKIKVWAANLIYKNGDVLFGVALFLTPILIGAIVEFRYRMKSRRCKDGRKH